MGIKIVLSLNIFASIFVIAACAHVKPYSVKYQNVSEQRITNLRGFWGEECKLFLGIGNYPGSDSNQIIYSGITAGEVKCVIPGRIGGEWVNANGKEVKYWVPISKQKIPKLGKTERYQFIVGLRQNDIRQVELVIHDSNNVRQKKRKVMLYCALPNGCVFNSPFTADTFHDCESLTSEQLKKLREDNFQRRDVMERIHKGIGVDIREQEMDMSCESL